MRRAAQPKLVEGELDDLTNICHDIHGARVGGVLEHFEESSAFASCGLQSLFHWHYVLVTKVLIKIVAFQLFIKSGIGQFL